MFPSNASAHGAAQAPCVRRACARGKVQRARRRLLRTTKRPGKMAVSVRRGWRGWRGWRGLRGWRGWRGGVRPRSLPHRALFPLQDKEKKKKESILDLSKYIDKTIRVKFQGGREGKAPPPAPSTVHEE